MADVAQLASSLVTLADLTVRAVQLVRRLYSAQRGAQELYRKVERLSDVVSHMRHLVESEQNAEPSRPVSQDEQYVRRGVLESIKQCQISISTLNRKLQFLQDDHAITMRTRLRFVLLEGVAKRHEADIEAQFQSLTLSLVILNGLSNQSNHGVTHESQRLILKILHTFVCLMINQQLPVVGVVVRPARVTSTTDQAPPHSPLIHPERIEDTHDASELLAERLEATRQPLNVPERSADEASIREMFDVTDESDATVDSPLATAVKADGEYIVQCLVDRNADITERDTEGWTLLHHAVFARALGSLQVLLSSGAGKSRDFINAQNHYGQTALMLAAEQAYNSTVFEMAEKLATEECDINVTARDGSTALSIVITQTWDLNRDRFARFLVGRGADVEAVRELQNSQTYSITREVLFGAQPRNSVISTTS